MPTFPFFSYFRRCLTDRSKASSSYCQWAQAGFTLMEVLVVMAIIGILASIAVPAYQRYTAQARLTSALGSLRSQQLEIEQSMINGVAFDTDRANPLVVPYGTLSVVNEGGLPSLRYRFAEEVARALSGVGGKESALLMTRSTEGQWECRTEGIQARLVPSECQA